MDALLQAQNDGVVIGLEGVTGIKPRLDIDEMLLEQPDTFNLFLLALKDLQEDEDTTKPMGYFQIAGIHGLPKTLWKDVEVKTKTKNPGDQDGLGSGYCAHAVLTFPTWHRPYLAMMEQTLFVKMLELAKTYTDSERYLKAASEFRLPYWDYFRPRNFDTVFPGVTLGQDTETGEFVSLNDVYFSDPKSDKPGKTSKLTDVSMKVKVESKDGKEKWHNVDMLNSTKYPYDFGIPQVFLLEKLMMRIAPHDTLKLVHNPLRTFWFPTNNELPESDWDFEDLGPEDFSRGHTVRHILFGYKSPFQGTNIRMNHILNKVRANGVSQIVNMICNDPAYKDYEIFATAYKEGTSKQRSGSLEGLHNSYHDNIGGSGHMSSVPVAAFDPIFWMHHANIDRYLAIWQAANPNSWYDPATKKLKPGLETLQEPLLPFFKPKSKVASTIDTANPDENCWTSEDAANTRSFGYTFKEVKTSPEETVEEFRRRYGWSIRPQPTPSNWKPSPPPDLKPLDLSTAQVYLKHPEYLKPSEPSVTTIVEPILRAVQLSNIAASNTVSTMKAMDNITSETIEASSVAKPVTGKRVEWFIDDAVERMSLNGSFSIYYFIGPAGGAITVPPQDYAVAPTLAGSTYIFAAPKEACDNCGNQDEAHHMVSDTTPITPMLLDYIKIGELANLEPENVKPFLVDRLRWRIQKINGETKNPRDLPGGLKMSISSKVSVEPVGTEPPVVKNHPDVVAEILHNAS